MDGEIIEPAPEEELEQRLPSHLWATQIDWAVATEHEVYGQPDSGSQPVRWAIYDAGEDDPPLAVCDDEDIALEICEALKAYCRLIRP
jgi:hypothetical protein